MLVSRLVLFGARTYFFSFLKWCAVDDVSSHFQWKTYHNLSIEHFGSIALTFFFKSHSKSSEVRVKFDKQHLRAIRRREQLCVYNLKLFNVLNLGQIRITCSYSVCQFGVVYCWFKRSRLGYKPSFGCTHPVYIQW